MIVLSMRITFITHKIIIYDINLINLCNNVNCVFLFRTFFYLKMESFITFGSVGSGTSNKRKNELTEEFVYNPTSTSINQNLNMPDKAANELKKHYLFNGKYFKIESIVENKLTAKCQLCLKVVQGQISSTGNFLSHIKVSTLINNIRIIPNL